MMARGMQDTWEKRKGTPWGVRRVLSLFSGLSKKSKAEMLWHGFACLVLRRARAVHGPIKRAATIQGSRSWVNALAAVRGDFSSQDPCPSPDLLLLSHEVLKIVPPNLEVPNAERRS